MFYYVAFFELMTSRQFGFGEGPIPITAIIQYGQWLDCDHEEIEDLIYFITVMDQAYLKKKK